MYELNIETGVSHHKILIDVSREVIVTTGPQKHKSIPRRTIIYSVRKCCTGYITT